MFSPWDMGVGYQSQGTFVKTPSTCECYSSGIKVLDRSKQGAGNWKK